MTIILSIPNRFKNVFTRSFLGKYVVKRTSKIPSHLANVATLPCETLMSAKQERDCFVHYLRLLALCWPSVQVHETITFLLVTLPNIYRFKKFFSLRDSAINIFNLVINNSTTP